MPTSYKDDLVDTTEVDVNEVSMVHSDLHNLKNTFVR